MESRASPSPTPGAANAPEVAEFQGRYGSYHVSELLLQKIWLRGAFDQSRARTLAGATLTVLHPGTWNRLSGPDFRDARLLLDGHEVTGDIEVHFHAEAWKQHGHDTDRAYDRVVLHVVLFPPPAHGGGPLARTTGGREIPVLVLVDLLWHDLEEYATDEAVAALSGRDAMPLVEHLLALEPAARMAAVRAAAELRWQEKLRYARLRLERCGWDEACHLTALEILGYRANREAMLRVGTTHPWSTWSRAVIDGRCGPSLDALFAAGGEHWTLRGVRPANQPRLRLVQYQRWMTRAPDWPRRLRAFALPSIDDHPAGESVVRQRRRAGHARLRAAIAHELTGDELGGLRLDTFAINLILPYLAAAPDTPRRDAETAAAWWRLWTPGDIAESLLVATRQLAAPGSRETRTNAMIQGLLGLHLQRVCSADASR
ncbi:MAG: DUF2851 family protein [Opitutaceae bacterium]|nr:DUF2851 family protein [Opitutaceae bacterium]